MHNISGGICNVQLLRTVKKQFFIFVSFFGFSFTLAFIHIWQIYQDGSIASFLRLQYGIIHAFHQNYSAELIWMNERKMTFKAVLSLFLVHLMDNPDKLNIGRAQSNQATKLCKVIGPSTNCISFGVLERLLYSENNWVQEVLADLRLESRVSYFDSTHMALPEWLKQWQLSKDFTHNFQDLASKLRGKLFCKKKKGFEFGINTWFISKIGNNKNQINDNQCSSIRICFMTAINRRNLLIIEMHFC